ncbi:MAG TPA: diacylglycerol kinase family protein [Terriglobales bacterium]|nr:diacylglycerol kinase family protein [Terriglobales bacterium]
MQKALLIYNPFSGFRRHKRIHQVEAAAEELRRSGIEAKILPSRGPSKAGAQAKEAIQAGYDAIFACGGDGTIHDVLQGMVGEAEATLGIVPLGTANALAADLKIPRDPILAIRRQLQYRPKTIAAGLIESCHSRHPKHHRYFTVMAGVGPDALLVYSLSADAKARWGVAAYVANSLWEYITYRHEPYEMKVTDAAGRQQNITTAQVMAVRIQDFGGPLKRFARGADLSRNDLRVVIFRGGVRLSYPAYLLAALFGLQVRIPGVELTDAREIVCSALPGREDRRVYCEADGECLWRLPVRISIRPNAFNLLMPE